MLQDKENGMRIEAHLSGNVKRSLWICAVYNVHSHLEIGAYIPKGLGIQEEMKAVDVESL